ncbi:HEPN domain-containing protein [Clostridium sp. D43t1_170807_H7]|uniref:HEPN domain-containing protein n=1 Tax=Clostridium sp. D43t1_170807_H7 TaxID=2787140 RepID=UPI0018996EC1|nr:HEPN domain-containing protein [Clostridium sp. D43t1_170807_H7]
MINMSKYIPIHGIKLNKPLSLEIPIKCVPSSMIMYSDNNYIDSINFLTYSEYLSLNSIINKNDIKECDLIAEFSSISHNTLEVENLKIVLSAIYFADRMSNTNKIKYKFMESTAINYMMYGETVENAINLADDLYNKTNNEFFSVYKLPGYRDNNTDFKEFYWYISLGNYKVTNDNFDRFITRAFSSNLDDEYIRQRKFQEKIVHVDVNDTFIDYIEFILKRLNNTDEYSKKIKASLRLYYSVLYESDIEQTILTYVAILETLLLSKSETKAQKAKVSNRCACIVANKMNKSAKTFIANQVSYFYNYRNSIIHDGKAFLEIDHESNIINILISIRHLIYFILKYVIENNIKEISDIETLVKHNLKSDGITDLRGYITYSKENPNNISLIYDDY